MTAIPERLAAALADRYRLERELGAGGMATVYLAQDRKHDREVAVKVLRPELAAVIGAERFLSEIKTTAHLQHPHILPLFDSGAADSFLFYVMPYVEGESLRDRLSREKQLPIADAVRIATEVAGALDYAHRHGVIHRDIKPENILLHDGRALVADFGIALAASKAGGTRITETGMSLGTPTYMSPEQAMGERTLDARTDVYALGCVTYEMLVGDPPFTGSTAQAIVAKVMTEKPAALIAQRDTVPEPVEDAVLTALAKLPADRFASAAEFAAALTATGSGAPRPRGRRAVRGWRLGALLVGVAAVAGAAGALLRCGPSPGRAIVRFSVPVRLGDIDFGPGLDISPDGTQIVFIGRTPDGQPALFRRALAESQLIPIPGTGGTTGIIRSPTFSPDGRMVAYTSQSELRLIAIQGGNEHTLVDSVSPTSGGLSWGPGGIIVFQRIFGAGLSIVSVNGGRARELTRVDTARRADHRWPQILPDGKSVIFTEWTGVSSSSHVKLASIATGQVRDLLAGSFARYTGDGHLVFIGPGQSLERVAFDLSSGRIRGEPVVVDDSVYVPGDGSAQFAISQTGTLAYLPSLGRRVPVTVDWEGVATPVRDVNPDLYMSPRYAPHDRRFAMEVAQGSADIWLYDPDGETFSKISDGGGYYSVWTPDGSRILYSRDEQAEVNVYSVPVNRSEGRRTVLAHHGQERTQDLSHDGKHLLLRQSTGPGQYDLFVMAPDSGAAPTPWLVTPFLERAPAFSPNDRWVAYSSNESGKDEVYVRPFAGPGGRIPVSSGGGIEPAWSRDGSELFYRASDGSLVMVKVEAGATFRVVSRPTTLFQNHYYAYAWARQYDVAPDGRHFLFLRNEAAEINLNVVVNWMSADQGGPPR